MGSHPWPCVATYPSCLRPQQALSKRVEQMEQQGQAAGEAGRSGLEDLRQQAARLAAQLTELQVWWALHSILAA